MEFNPIMEEKIILVVDDSNITRNLIEHVFKNKYKVLMASNGKGAMDIVDVMEDLCAKAKESQICSVPI